MAQIPQEIRSSTEPSTEASVVAGPWADVDQARHHFVRAPMQNYEASQRSARYGTSFTVGSAG